MAQYWKILLWLLVCVVNPGQPVYMTAEKIKGADFTHRIKFVLLVY